jgi:O-antigen/teichoic acid export membrane protein
MENKYFFLSKGFKKYGGNTLFLFVERVYRTILGITVGILLARYLGPSGFGKYNLALSIAFIVSTFTALGLQQIVIKDLVESKKDKNNILGSSFYLIFFLNILVFTISFLIFINFQFKDGLYSLILVFLFSNIFLSFKVIEHYFSSQVLSKYTVYTNLIVLTTVNIAKLTLIYYKSSLFLIALITIFETFFCAIGLFFFYLVKGKSSIAKWSFNPAIAKSLIKRSFPLLLAAATTSLYMKIDQIMIAMYINDYSVGIYAAATKLSEGWYFISMIVTASFFPAIINAKNNIREQYLSRLQSLYTFLVFIAFLIAVLVSVFGQKIIIILYGIEYKDAAIILAIHIWSGIFVFMGSVFTKYLVAENLTKIAFYRMFMGLILNIILNIILIPMAGLIGAAIALLISQISVNFIFDIFNKKTRPQFYMKLNAILPIYLFRSEFK